MPHNRFFVSEEFNLKNECLISGQEFHHLANVVRLKEGEEVELVNGKGSLASAILIKKTRHDAFFNVKKISFFKPPSLKLSLTQAIPKFNKLEIIFEKCTELGVTEINLFYSEKGEKHPLSSSNIERLHYILVSAMKQSGRVYLPELIIRPNLNAIFKENAINFFGDIRENAIPLIKLLDQKFLSQTINFFIGPESGFSENEIKFFENHNFLKAKISNYILRTETASISAMSIIQQFYL